MMINSYNVKHKTTRWLTECFTGKLKDKFECD